MSPEVPCPWLIQTKGRSGEMHKLCHWDIAEGEFGSHETTCSHSTNSQQCELRKQLAEAPTKLPKAA